MTKTLCQLLNLQDTDSEKSNSQLRRAYGSETNRSGGSFDDAKSLNFSRSSSSQLFLQFKDNNERILCFLKTIDELDRGREWGRTPFPSHILDYQSIVYKEDHFLRLLKGNSVGCKGLI